MTVIAKRKPFLDSDAEFSGAALEDLILAVELAVGSRQAGMTPLGMAVIRLCEDALDRDRVVATESKS